MINKKYETKKSLNLAEVVGALRLIRDAKSELQVEQPICLTVALSRKFLILGVEYAEASSWLNSSPRRQVFDWL
ncbi:hypothetical protein EVAR_54208_1 [Eumeta japonica]|uniref:Uncharacterized protein n=1 Tax=Eumeta variegata TaxID=151549 RepID=A0A4C1YGZ9_EUMVA|nr:hypothetical protein EVAR_54208_1 [Eumeta japonica]